MLYTDSTTHVNVTQPAGMSNHHLMPDLTPAYFLSNLNQIQTAQTPLGCLHVLIRAIREGFSLRWDAVLTNPLAWIRQTKGVVSSALH